ncbi:MAG: hypothetical protein P4M11_02440, partial [Candidatus Pacebacteria bacterium]|nr:hypothetical protein [Candidatus Paceibacterota bacterium]
LASARSTREDKWINEYVCAIREFNSVVKAIATLPDVHVMAYVSISDNMLGQKALYIHRK